MPPQEEKEEKKCYWFDIGNWRFSDNPDEEEYLPNQWWVLVCEDQSQ
jgi:hypothetical protein